MGDACIVGEDWSINAYIQVVERDHWPSGWLFKNVRFSIRCVSWEQDEELQEALEQSDRYSFKASPSGEFDPLLMNRGWKPFLTSCKAGCHLNKLLSPQGYLLIQGEVDPSTVRMTIAEA